MTRAKKHLGQHFLKDKATLEKMVAIADVHADSVVLEIGPGKGVLTRALLDAGAHVLAVETDTDMVKVLHSEFTEEIENEQLEIVHDDILKCYRGLLEHLSEYKLVANIPYYITGAIIRKFLTTENKPKSMTLLVQKEVAERIVAKDGKESLLSISVKAYGVPHYAKTVPARYFSPPPKVDSAVLHIGGITKQFFTDVDEERFFKVVKSGFASKRKTLANNLSSFGGKAKVAEALSTIGVRPDARAEILSVEQWKKLVRELYPVVKNDI